VRQLSIDVSNMKAEEFSNLAKAYLGLGELHIKISDKRAVHSAVLQLRALVKKTEVHLTLFNMIVFYWY
jgi:hypothetical protein